MFITKCQKCGTEYSHSNLEIDFYQKVNLPLPTKCPKCRMQRRFAWRNERKLYHRKCDLTGKQIISIYPQDSQYKVYDQHEWYSDKWDALDYGQDFDFSKPFFSQYADLMKKVPKISVFTSKNENSDFTNGSQQNKNCYMIFVSDHDNDSYYSYAIDSCTDCIDCLNCFKSTLCLACIDCSDSYNLCFSDNTHNSSDSYFLSDCKNCKSCFACFGLRGKSFCILNKQYSETEYNEKIKEFKISSYEKFKEVQETFTKELKTKKVCQYYDGNKNQDVTGDHIVNCKSCENCYDSGDLEDCGNLIFSYKSKDCYDGHVVVDKSELCLETISTINQYNTQFTFCSWYSKNSMYLDHCVSCEDCYACSGLKKQKYCIFNKQYSKEEYEILKKQIIEHMKQTGEWGEAPQVSLSPFGYNQTVANEYFPLTLLEAEKLGYNWYNEDNNNYGYTGPEIVLKDDINEETDDILGKILLCDKSKKPYKIIPQELKLYRHHGVPLPRMCFEERHLERINKRNPRELWDRKCMKCEKTLKSTYSPEREEVIYCEDCYLQEIN
jgi:hypothetical protein